MFPSRCNCFLCFSQLKHIFVEMLPNCVHQNWYLCCLMMIAVTFNYNNIFFQKTIKLYIIQIWHLFCATMKRMNCNSSVTIIRIISTFWTQFVSLSSFITKCLGVYIKVWRTFVCLFCRNGDIKFLNKICMWIQFYIWNVFFNVSNHYNILIKVISYKIKHTCTRLYIFNEGL